MPESMLSTFLATLATEPAIRKTFLSDAVTMAKEAGLSKDERAVLATGKFHTILDFLDDGPRPSSPEIQPGGGNGSNECPRPSGAGRGLGGYVATLARDPDTRAHYLRDPANALHDARLAPEEEAVIQTGELLTILDYLDRSGPRPSSPEIMSGGTGAGQAGGGEANAY